jgi:hypothetical protein
MSGLVRTCLDIGRICPVRTDPLDKMLINHVLLIETLSNLTQRYSSIVETTYLKDELALKDYQVDHKVKI